MFDPQTTELIHQAPKLPELDLDRLPQELTKAFAEIVAFRVRLTGGQETLPEELVAKLDELRRLAATFEGMVALHVEQVDRRSAAFVAAQAYQLLHLARASVGQNIQCQHPLRANAIAPEVSALLLFLIANQPSDAMEMARLLADIRPKGSTASTLLIDALTNLAAGRLEVISTLVNNITKTSLSDDSVEVAVEALYGRILYGIVLLSQFLLYGHKVGQNLVEEAMACFREVQQLAIQDAPWPFEMTEAESLFNPVSSIVGPHHLATLFLAATDFLVKSSLSAVVPPIGVELSVWSDLLAPIISKRPFLWPNHLEALREGFISSGISAVVSFPTGAGKTTLSELKIASTLALGGAVIYLAPTHALVFQTKTNLSEAFPNISVRDSLLVEDFYAETDEVIMSTSAQIIVMTPERCLALLSLGGSEFKVVRLVVFDECHLLHPSRPGRNRRSLDAMLAVLHMHDAAPEADWLLLSAMMANAEDLAEWMQVLTKRPCLALCLDWKPTRQVRGCLVYNGNEIKSLKELLKREEALAQEDDGKLPAPGRAIVRQLAASPYGLLCLRQTWQTLEVRDYALLKLLHNKVPLTANIAEKATTPYWYLTPNKNEVAAHLAAQCVQAGMKVLLFLQNTGHVNSIAEKINKLLGSKTEKTDFSDHEQLLLETAIEEMGAANAVLVPTSQAGSHHGLMLPVERELAELRFRRRDGIHALAATATLAQGMNLPADIVFIVGEERFDAGTNKFERLEAHELLNAAGRAGRAGHVAQGMVVVLPHSLVDFNATNNRISTRWKNLQEAVFSRTDQCLTIEDPIQNIIDRIQNNIEDCQSDPDVRYFIRRLPPGTEEDLDAPKRFLRSTLGAYQAKKQNSEAVFEKVIENTINYQNSAINLSVVQTWRDEMAYRSGIAVDFIEVLHQEMLRIAITPPSNMEGWVRWFFGWLCASKERLEVVFGHRLMPELKEHADKVDLFGGGLADAVWGWMSGETLLLLNPRVGGKLSKPGECKHARKFVLQVIPDLAFAAGLATRIRRKQLEEIGETQIPLDLAILALCIREGVSSPELAALKLEYTNQPLSRKRLSGYWNHISRFVSSPKKYERFGHCRKRIQSALASYFAET